MKIPFFTKKNEVTEKKSDIFSSFFEWVGYSTASNAVVSETTSLQVPAVFCAARVIAEGVSSMPVDLKERIVDKNGKARMRLVTSHWSHRLMSQRPNSWQTPAEFIEGMTFIAAIAGAALAVKNVVRGEVKELIPVVPGGWTVDMNTDFSLIYRVNYGNGKYGEFTQDQVLVLRGPSLDGYRGLSSIRAAKEAIGLSMTLEKQQAKLAGNGGKPSGVLSFPHTLDPETVAQLKKDWQQKFGPDGEGGIAILDGDAKFFPMTMTSVDAQTMESRRFQIEEIARAFRVLPLMLMQADKAATFASVEQMSRMHVTHTLMPWVRRWEQVLSRDVLRGMDDLFFDFDESLLLRGDHKDQAEYFVKALGAGGSPGWMTPNEVREHAGLAPSDQEWANKIPQGSMGEMPTNAPSSSQDNQQED